MNQVSQILSSYLNPRCLAYAVVGTDILSLMSISIPKEDWEMQNICVRLSRCEIRYIFTVASYQQPGITTRHLCCWGRERWEEYEAFI